MVSFGLTNAPATLQAVMNRVFKDVIGKVVMVYLDNILIFSRSPEEHRAHLRQVLQILQDSQLYAKLLKCSFGQSSVAFLGHTLSADGLSMDLSKVSAVINWPVPQDIPQMRSFLGLANYFCKFVTGYSPMTIPLSNLLRKNVPWLWSDSCQEAFDGLKAALTSARVLTLPKGDPPWTQKRHRYSP